MGELKALLFCAAIGFATAAMISNFYQLITSERAEFLSSRTGRLAVVVTILLTMFGGPFIVMRKVIAGLRSRELHAIPAALGVIVAGMWSVCAGVVYISVM